MWFRTHFTKHLALWREFISLSARVIDSPNPHNLKGDAETVSDSPSQQTSRVSKVPVQESCSGLANGGRHLTGRWRHVMSVPDNVTKMARGIRVPWERLLLGHLSLRGACPRLWCSPPAQGRQAASRAAQGCWPVVVKGSTEMSLVIVCGTWWVWHHLKQMFLVPVSVGWAGKQHRAPAQRGSPGSTVNTVAKSRGSLFAVLESPLEPSSQTTLQKPGWFMLPVLNTESCTYQIRQQQNL